MKSSSAQFAVFCLLVGVTLDTAGRAAERAQVDLSVSVGMTPATFTPGGHNTFSVTVHNAGPDHAGMANPDSLSIGVYGNSIVFPSTQPPPMEILGILTGDCGFFRFSEPLPNGDWIVQFSYFFGPLAAGESRTCSSDIEFSALASTNILTNWRVDSARDDDINPSNNNTDYTFVAAPPAPPVSVPTGSPSTWLMLGFGLLLVASMTLRRVRS